jgi:hypothetical protein
MEGVRAGFIGAENGLGPDSQTRLLPATSVFERVIWLANRYATALDRQGASAGARHAVGALATA